MKILIVEDNPDMRDLLAIRVQMTGYLPVLASHGKEGVEKANAEKPDLILDGHDDASNGRLGSSESASRLS
jgi:DNA-binding response OmpR family regulator